MRQYSIAAFFRPDSATAQRLLFLEHLVKVGKVNEWPDGEPAAPPRRVIVPAPSHTPAMLRRRWRAW